MIRATTPTLELVLDDDSIDLAAAREVYVTLRQGARKLTKSGNAIAIDANVVSVHLTQEETLAFFPLHNVDVQLNWTYPGGARAASEIGRISVGENLLPEVLT